MNIGIFEISMFIFIPVATLLLNAWRKGISRSQRLPQAAYLLVSTIMAGAPLVYVRSIEQNHTDLGMVLACVALFWFAIVGSRGANT